METPPPLRKPAAVLKALLDKLTVIGEPRKVSYLRSANPRHRWARDSFADAEEEFKYKATWVAKQIREEFGPPDHSAFLALAGGHLVGIRAAAWAKGSAVAFVSLREIRARRRSLVIVLGAVRPSPRSSSGPEGLEARDAVWANATQLLH